MTTTEPAGAVSTKCSVSLGDVVSEPGTILTVYAGLHILRSELVVGEII